ncbi:hypothetical protein QBC34DRAFT_438214 [Podospora aff. communis PSN243]|uniref:Uncharacterized protein n=1 Tax=Podospora aff. communis PSN243 TaxID=3040156 RepID=A0AAV9GS20_9PEZI|nr:hypothetical protein QBC34DRAFT_438214 [Podospora aff. communis PSN243]
MQSSNRYRQRADKHHHERRDRGENGRHNRSGKPDGHRHTRHPQQRHNHDDVLETIPATLAVDEEARVDDYIETWLRKTQESRAQRERDENEERQRTMPQKESPRAHLEVLRRKTTKKRARPIPNPAASLSGRSEHAEERFEKRARHKTLADKYEYRPDRGKKKHRAVEELEVAVNKPGKKKVWEIQAKIVDEPIMASRTTSWMQWASHPMLEGPWTYR